MAENKSEWEMLGDVDLKVSDFVDLAAHGAPAVADTLIGTPEGRKVLWQLAKAAIGEAYDRFGVFGVVGLAGLTVLLAGPVKDLFGLLGKLKSAAETGDMVFALLEDLKSLKGKAGEMIAAFQMAAAKNIGDRITAAREDSAGGKAAEGRPLIAADPAKLRAYAETAQRCRGCLAGLEDRIGWLYRRTGLAGLLGVMDAAALSSAVWRLGRCGTWLYNAADRLEHAEQRIRSAEWRKI